MKPNLKEKAINLRKRGFSYSEILKQVPVSRSTLSLWLRSVGLSQKQKQRLTEKKLLSMRRGWLAKKQQRLDLLDKIKSDTRKDIKKLTSKDLWLTGVLLYWAEGSKEKRNSIGQQVKFSNSDPRMIMIFLKWLGEIMKINNNNINFELYIHKTANLNKALNYWSQILSCPKDKFRVYFKQPKTNTNRKNIGNSYNGLIRLSVKRSSILNRKIAAWIEHICNYWEVV